METYIAPKICTFGMENNADELTKMVFRKKDDPAVQEGSSNKLHGYNSQGYWYSGVNVYAYANAAVAANAVVYTNAAAATFAVALAAAAWVVFPGNLQKIGADVH